MKGWLVFIAMLLASNAAMGSEGLCTYTTYQWNIYSRKAVGHRKVVKPYGDLTATEIDAQSRCSVCEEDQVTLAFPGLRPFKVCKHIAQRVRQSMVTLLKEHAPLREVTGYRVGMTRGEIDPSGNRTGFSNHSFGVALDVNTAQNGLYVNCIEFGPACGLVMGGQWNPDQPLSLTQDSPIVLEFKRIGFKWGGEIAGQQKDFMHFSPTGY